MQAAAKSLPSGNAVPDLQQHAVNRRDHLGKVRLMQGSFPTVVSPCRLEHSKMQQRATAMQVKLPCADTVLHCAQISLFQRRREHMTMENKVRIAREMQDAYGEDHAVLTSHMHDMRAAKEDAERELAHTRKMCEEAKKDWHRKLKDRRKEVGCHAVSVSERCGGYVVCMHGLSHLYRKNDMAKAISILNGGQASGQVLGG